MKNIFLLALILATSVAAKDSISIGTFADGTEFMAEKHFFGKRIEGFDLVPGSPKLCLRFSENNPSVQQELGLYDISSHRLKWKVDVDYKKDYYIPTSLGIILYSEKKAFLLNDKGDICWEMKKFLPFYADVQDSVVFGYPTKRSDELKGVSMSQGQNLWTAKISQKGGWSEVLPLENGEMLISSDKICKLNALTGKMRTVDIDNVHYNKKHAMINALGNALGIGAGIALGGPYIFTYTSTEIPFFYQLNSNFCVNDDHIYYADRCRLLCMDDNLRIIWEKELPKKASISNIYIQEDTLFYENTGWGKNAEGFYYRDTRAYCMRYDRRDGTELSEKENLKEEESFVYCYLKEPDSPYFTPRRLTIEEINKKEKNKIEVYRTYNILSLTHRLVSCGRDFWIVDMAGNALLHFTKPILQTAVVDNVLVGLTDQNVIFQFNLSSLKI